MKKSALAVICVLCLLCQSAFAMTFEEFREKTEAFWDKKVKPEEMVKACNLALSKHVGEDKEYASYVHALRGHLYWLKRDDKKAKSEAEKAVELDPTSDVAYGVMSDVLVEEGKYAEAADMVDKAIANHKYLSKPEMLKSVAEKLRLKAATVTPAALWQAFDENEVAAEDTYKGKEVVVKGKIASITTNVTGNPQISFAVDQQGFHSVVFEFSKDAKPEIAKLKKRQEIMLAGTCRGMLIKNVVLLDSRIIPQ